MGTIYRVDGTKEEISPANGKTFTLEELQAIVGGLIEPVYINNDLDNPEKELLMYVNEEGKLEDLPINEVATKLAEKNLWPGDYIAGDVIVLTEEEERAGRGEDDEDEDEDEEDSEVEEKPTNESGGDFTYIEIPF